MANSDDSAFSTLFACNSAAPFVRFVRNPFFIGVALFVFLTAASFVSLSFGSSGTDFAILQKILASTADETSSLIFCQIRLPRLCVALLAGASLSLAGAVMQSLFRNPLADPSIIGVSSGAALGAVFALLFAGAATSFFSMQISAALFGLGAVFFVCLIGRGSNTLSLLLGGIALNAFCGAIVGYCLYTARDTGMRSYIFWTLGSLENADWNSIALASAIALPMWIVALRCARGLNLLHLGWEQAFHSGANIVALRNTAIFSSALMTAAAVSICGIIGFVGLVVPHLIRLITGPDNRSLLPLSALAGALLIVCSDLLSRFANPTDPVPIGVITALIGVPFFVFLLKFGKGKNG